MKNEATTLTRLKESISVDPVRVCQLLLNYISVIHMISKSYWEVPMRPCLALRPRIPYLVLVTTAAMFWASGARAQDPPFEIVCNGSDVATDIENAAYDPDTSFILLTAGECFVGRTIKLVNIEGLRIEGEGRDKTVLTWNGESSDAPMFSIQNSTGVSVAQLGICVEDDSTMASAFDLFEACHSGVMPDLLDRCAYYHPAWAQRGHANVFEDVGIAACPGTNNVLNNGIRVRLHPDHVPGATYVCGNDEEADCENGQHSFDRVHVSEFTESAFVLEGQASTGNMFMACTCDGQHGTESDDGLFDTDCCGDTCVRTGQEDTAGTAGSFTWYGGMASRLSDSVFRIGATPDRVHISGLSADRSRRLLRTAQGEADTASAIAIESVHFDTAWVHNWDLEKPMLEDTDHSDPLSLIPGVGGLSMEGYGIVVHVKHRGPLTMRNSYFGQKYTTNGDDPPKDLDNISFCWTFPESGEDMAFTGGFVFEGNTVATGRDNPFLPQAYIGHVGGTISMDSCVYPTSQSSNLLATQWNEDNSDLEWEQMPHHWSELDSAGVADRSVATRPTSHEFFEVEGTSDSIKHLADGIPGQVVVLLGRESFSFGTTIENSILELLWPAFGVHNLHIREGLGPVQLGLKDTLTLVKGPDEYWYQVGHSDH